MNDNIGKLESKSRIRMSTGVNIVGFILSLLAGWIDTIGVSLLFVNECSSFMTGRVKLLGYHLFNLDFKLFWSVLLVIIAFIIGSFISTLVTQKTGLKGGLLLTGIFVIISSLPVAWQNTTIFLPMAMGCQNAATSLTPINRTTHLTGPITDLGMSLAKKNWNGTLFWVLRLIGFALGAFIGFALTSIFDRNPIYKSILMIIPAIIIVLIGIVQEKIIDIPLLD